MSAQTMPILRLASLLVTMLGPGLAAANPPSIVPTGPPPVINPNPTNAVTAEGEPAVSQTVSATGLFSYTAPAGWEVLSLSSSNFPVAAAPDQGGFRANLRVEEDDFSSNLMEYAASVRQRLQTDSQLTNVFCGPNIPFRTKDNTQGLLIIVTDTVGGVDLAQRYYLFKGANGKKLLVIGTATAAEGSALGPVFDFALRSFSPK
jgi:hypothetical protein